MASLTVSVEPHVARRFGTLTPLVPRPSSPAPDFVDLPLSSAEELSRAAAGSATYCQLGAGRFRGRLTRLRTPQFELCLESWSLGMLKKDRVPLHGVVIVVPLKRGSSARLQGRLLAAGEVAVLFGGEAFDYRSSDSEQLLTVAFERAALEGEVRSLTAGGLTELRVEGRLEGLRVDPSRLRNLCGRAVARAAVPSWRSSSGVRAREFAGSLVKELFGERALRREAAAEPLGPDRSRALALKAEAWLRQCLSEPPTIADLCAAVGAGERTIHEAFREHLGTSPIAYLKALRLNAARHALCCGAAGTKVTDIALDWGFLHFGWFSQDYRRLFGETPSQTLQRARLSRRPLLRDGDRATA
jgi:AraC family ethanolamine operon transcriptional activator